MTERSDTAKLGDALRAPALEPDLVLAAKGSTITFGGKLFMLSSRFVIAYVLARLLGAGEYGLYTLALSAITLATSLALFGIDISLVRYIPMYVRRQDEARLWGTLQIGLGIPVLLSVLIGTALFSMAQPIAQQLFGEPKLSSLLRVASVIVPFFTLNYVCAAATQGFKKMQYATIARDVVQPLIRLTLILGLAVVGLSASSALAVFGIAVAATSALLIFFLNNLFALKRSLREARRETKQILSFSGSVYLTDLMILFQENVQTLLLGALNTVASVGRFAVANQINLLGSVLQGSITIAARPIIAELYDRGDREQMGRVYQTTTKWMLTANLPLFLIIVLFPKQILSIFGESFVGASTALLLLTCANMVNVGTGMCGAIIDMSGHIRLKLINAVVQLALALGLSVLLIPRWGIVGAATAALLGISTINILRVVEVFVLFRLLPYNASIVKPIAAGAAALAATLCMDQLIGIQTTYLRMAINGATLGTVYAGVILLLGLSSEDRALLARLKKRLLHRLPRR